MFPRTNGTTSGMAMFLYCQTPMHTHRNDLHWHANATHVKLLIVWHVEHSQHGPCGARTVI